MKGELYDLIPAIYRQLDGEGRPLARFLGQAEELLGRAEASIARAYDDHFIETCSVERVVAIAASIDEWVPHATALRASPLLGRLARVTVANALSRRRAAGSLSTLELAARETSGFDVRVVRQERFVVGSARVARAHGHVTTREGVGPRAANAVEVFFLRHHVLSQRAQLARSGSDERHRTLDPTGRDRPAVRRALQMADAPSEYGADGDFALFVDGDLVPRSNLELRSLRTWDVAPKTRGTFVVDLERGRVLVPTSMREAHVTALHHFTAPALVGAVGAWLEPPKASSMPRLGQDPESPLQVKTGGAYFAEEGASLHHAGGELEIWLNGNSLSLVGFHIRDHRITVRGSGSLGLSHCSHAGDLELRVDAGAEVEVEIEACRFDTLTVSGARSVRARRSLLRVLDGDSPASLEDCTVLHRHPPDAQLLRCALPSAAIDAMGDVATWDDELTELGILRGEQIPTRVRWMQRRVESLLPMGWEAVVTEVPVSAMRLTKENLHDAR